jgi:hypothetical protein
MSDPPIKPTDVLRKVATAAVGIACAVLASMVDVAPEELVALAEASGRTAETQVPLGNGYSLVCTFSVAPTPPGPLAN